MRSRTCAEHHIRPSITSIFASLVNGRESNHLLYQWPSQAFIEHEERRIVCGCPKTRQLVSGWIWSSRFTCEAVFTSLSSAWTKWRSDHATGRLQLNPSQSFLDVRISVVGITTIFAANNAVWMRCNHFVLKTDPVSFAKTGCRRRGLRKPRPTLRRIDARPPLRRRQRRKPVKRPWTIPWRSTLRKRPYNYLPNVPSPRGRPRRNGRKQPRVQDPGAESGSVSKASDTRPLASSSHHRHHSSGDRRSLSSTSSMASPDRRSPPSHHERRRESADRTGQTYVARRDLQLSPKISKPPEKRTIMVVSSPARQVHVESAPEVQVPAPVADGPAGADPATARPQVTARQHTTARPQATTRPQVMARPQVTAGPQVTARPQVTGRPQGTARPQGTTVDDPASDNPADVSVVESSHSSDLHFDEPDESDGPARLPAEGVDGSAGHGTPAATAPGGGPDVSMSTGTSSPLFPSITKTINQATLVDLMSLWTLLQRRMDQPSVPETSTSPAVQSSVPAPRHDSTNRRSATPARTPERRPKSPERFLHTPQSSISSLVRWARAPERQARTPVRQARTPVRQATSHSESRESRSRSPLSRSSSVESPARDEAPVNFTAAMDPDAKRAISDDEEDEGDSKKISAAQYQIFRQAVTTSKGSYKVNPAKTKRASRASLLDLGDTEVTDRVSWLDQLSLQDTMASTARIAQGLKEDKEVEKTTFSETLNTDSSSFKFFTVKQIFPREP